MEIEGQILDIIYQNEINGYMVAELVTQPNEQIVIVGYLPFVDKGDTLKLFGKFVVHQEYGEQFKVETFEKIMPKTLDALEKYLAGGIIKGIGVATANKIVKKFGEATIEILKNEPQMLAQIKGITTERAMQISQEFNEKWEMWQIVAFLEKFGISASNSKKVYEVLGKEAIEKIEADPYVLLDITYGVDFKKIDKIAMDLGVSYNDDKRIKSAIKYGILLASYNGNTCVIEENLIKFVKDLLDVSDEEIKNSLINLKAQEEVIIEKREENKWIYLKSFYNCEKNVATKLMLLNKSKNIKKISNIKKELKKTSERINIQLSEEQEKAIEMVNENNVTIITGGPGTGKTTTIKFIVEMYKAQKNKVVLCAPTGRATKRMSEATGEDAKTIHRLLEIRKLNEDNNQYDIDYPIAPIDADVIIIDEMSMVDIFLMNYILNRNIYRNQTYFNRRCKSITICTDQGTY